jgi:hypothetical protein
MPLAGSRRCLPAVEPKSIGTLQTPPIKFFRLGKSKGPEDHKRLHLPSWWIPNDYAYTPGKQEQSFGPAQTLNIVTSSFACLQCNCQMMTFTPTLCPQTFKPM